MIESTSPESGEISLFAVGTVLLRNRWRILRWMLVTGSIAAGIGFFKPALYTASASFIPQGTDVSRSGLANLAGQFGFSLPASNQTLSPDFYAKLITSQAILKQIARDTITVEELGRRRISFQELYDIRGGSSSRREEQGAARLSRMVSASVDKNTGVVQLSVLTRWPSVSLAIATALVDAVNEFNQRTRQGQAAAERKFTEGRLVVARGELRAAEDRLQGFLSTNRDFSRSPELTFERDRLQRDVMLQQQVFTSLTESLEDVRIREVRDTPVITIVESPSVETFPEPRRRVVLVSFAVLLGGIFGGFLAFLREGMARRRKQGDTEAEEFAGALGQVKGEVMWRVRTLKDRIRS